MFNRTFWKISLIVMAIQITLIIFLVFVPVSMSGYLLVILGVLFPSAIISLMVGKISPIYGLALVIIPSWLIWSVITYTSYYFKTSLSNFFENDNRLPDTSAISRPAKKD